MREVWGTELGDTVAQWLNLASEADGDDEFISSLAMLDLLSYERYREEAAKKLGIQRVTMLDKIVAARRQDLEHDEVSAGFLSPVEPWPEPVVGTELLDGLLDVYDRYIVLPNKHAGPALALWTLHTYAHEAATHSPIFDISSPAPRCGKTNLLTILSLLVIRPLSAANVTPAVVFRAIDRWHPTMLIDEGDTFLSDQSELRGVLNSGHKRSQAFVVRCVGDDFKPERFSTWCPKAFAHIGRMHPTLEDRAIRVTLRRKLKSDTVQRIPNSADAWLDIRRKAVRWCADHLDCLKKAAPVIPRELNDRAADNWEPLLAIADACGSDWAKVAREAAVALSGVDDDETEAIVLLRDLKTIFEREKIEDPSGVAMASVAIAVELAKMEDRKWPEYKHGKPITPANIAALLKLFKIFPRKVRSNGHQVQGYRFDQFEWTFKRYTGDGPQ
jgi:putative DNA primase/helicase